MMSEPDPSSLKLVGGRLCLDFVNTVSCRNSDYPSEYLGTYENLVSWSQHVKILTKNEAKNLAAKASVHPADARRIVERATATREALYRIFSAIIHKHRPEAMSVELLNGEIALAMAHLHLEPAASASSWTYTFEDHDIDRMLWLVVDSARELLTSDKLDRLCECPGENCGWLFLDLSRNRSRKWCSMEDCGNVVKARRYYEKLKRSKSSGLMESL
jgi:predicted RNA-binding Zn ribbon-like protein